MRYAFTEENEELRALVREAFAELSPESEVRRLMETPEGYDRGVWKQLGHELGIVGLIIPEEYGGLGQDFSAVGVVQEEAGSTLLCAPYFSSAVLAAATLVGCQDDAAKTDYLPALATGDLRGTLAVWEGDATAAIGNCHTQATRSAGKWELNGRKTYVIDGATAELVLVTARSDAGFSLFAVDSAASGLEVEPLSTLDLTRKQAHLRLEAVPARLIGPEGAAESLVSRTLGLAALALAAEQVGGAARVLDMAVDYAKVRFQYGRAIGSFQSIKHKCADMLLEVECAKSAVYNGLWATDDASTPLPLAASIAKSRSSDAFLHCAYENVQIHGGIGFTWEHPAHLYLRRAKSTQLLFGNPAYHRERVANLIGV